MKIKIPSIEQFKASFKLLTGKDADYHPISFADYCYWLPYEWFGNWHEVEDGDRQVFKEGFVIPSWMYEVCNE